MHILLTISWRNIWRHPARSGILLAAITIGVWAGIIVSGWGNGLIEQRINYLIGTELSHGQIHHPEFLTEREPWMYLEDAGSILDWLEEDERVRSFSPRTLTDGMARSPVTTSGVRIRGVDPVKEKETVTLFERVIEGDWFGGESRNPVVIGRELADKLNLELNDRLVLQFQDMENELTAGAFNIVGIFQSASTDYDERNVIVRSDDLSELLGRQQVYHEIAMSMTEENLADSVVADLNTEFPSVDAQTWYELSPEIRYYASYGGVMTYYMMVIIMLALAFGILNTMLMAIFERMRELGMLLSIGMSKSRVFTMIMVESVMLTLSGAVLGMLSGWLSIRYLGDRGIDMQMFGEGLAEFGIEPVTYPFVTTGEYFGVTGIVIIAALLAAVYPAMKAIRLNPVQAARE